MNDFTVSATFKAPPGHNRLTDVTLSVLATVTDDGLIAVEFGKTDYWALITEFISQGLTDTISRDALAGRGIRLNVTVVAPTADWLVPDGCRRAAVIAGNLINERLEPA